MACAFLIRVFNVGHFRVTQHQVLVVMAMAFYLVQKQSLCEAISEMQRLKQDLFESSKIDPHSRPVRNEEEVVHVEVNFDVTHILSLDEWTGTFTVNGLIKLTWEDKALKWSPDDFGGINYITIPPNIIWQPDLTVYNSARASDNSHYGNSVLYLMDDGVVHWFPPVTFHTTCPVDHKLFPFDEHACSILLGSWTYDTSSLFLHLGQEHNHSEITVMEHFTDNPQWELLKIIGTSKEIQHDCCNTYRVLEYRLYIRRRSPFYKFVLVVPSVLAMILTLALFWLPPYAGEKIILGGIVIIIQVALLLFLGWAIPPGGASVPAIVLFCGNSLVMSGVSLVIAVIIISLSRSCTHTQLSTSLRSLLLGPLGRMLCLRLNSCQTMNMKLLDDNHVEMGDQINHISRPNDHEQCRKYPESILLATAIDRLCFIIYTVTFVAILISSFSG